MGSPYRNIDCPNCGRHRVQGDAFLDEDGVCEKCNWDVDAGTYASVSRPGARCIKCHGDEIDLATGECRGDIWHDFPSVQ